MVFREYIKLIQVNYKLISRIRKEQRTDMKLQWLWRGSSDEKPALEMDEQEKADEQDNEQIDEQMNRWWWTDEQDEQEKVHYSVSTEWTMGKGCLMNNWREKVFWWTTGRKRLITRYCRIGSKKTWWNYDHARRKNKIGRDGKYFLAWLKTSYVLSERNYK